VQQFRDALDRSVTLSRDRIQEVADDAVKRGRMTRSDANKLVSDLVSRGRKQSDRMLRDLERMLTQSRREAERGLDEELATGVHGGGDEKEASGEREVGHPLH